MKTTEQLARLAELGCDLAQGCYISKPLPADEVKPSLAGSTT
jgi:EAL domain-containing protein (putative c-di-GMP-specific phosphodiesterase class I)